MTLSCIFWWSKGLSHNIHNEAGYYTVYVNLYDDYRLIDRDYDTIWVEKWCKRSNNRRDNPGTKQAILKIVSPSSYMNLQAVVLAT